MGALIRLTTEPEKAEHVPFGTNHSWSPRGHLAHRELFPEDFGIERAGIELLKVQNAQQSADIIIRVLEGQPGAARDIVSMNAAAALWISGICDDLSAGIERCRMAIDKGHAKQILKELIETTNS